MEEYKRAHPDVDDKDLEVDLPPPVAGPSRAPHPGLAAQRVPVQQRVNVGMHAALHNAEAAQRLLDARFEAARPAVAAARRGGALPARHRLAHLEEEVAQWRADLHAAFQAPAALPAPAVVPVPVPPPQVQARAPRGGVVHHHHYHHHHRAPLPGDGAAPVFNVQLHINPAAQAAVGAAPAPPPPPPAPIPIPPHRARARRRAAAPAVPAPRLPAPARRRA